MNRCTQGLYIYDMEAQSYLFKNVSYYGRSSSNAYFFRELIFKCYICLVLQNWLVDSGTISAGSVSQTFEERYYYRSMRLHKEGFNTLVQRRVEDITNKFELTYPDLLSVLSELRQRPSRKALECVTNMKE